MPSWAKAALDAWLHSAGLDEGHVFRSLRKGSRLDGCGMTDQVITDVVRAYIARGWHAGRRPRPATDLRQGGGERERQAGADPVVPRPRRHHHIPNATSASSKTSPMHPAIGSDSGWSRPDAN